MARAWLFQDHRQKQKLGDKCPWSVGWITPEGKRRSKRIGSKSLAQKFARKREGELAAGVYTGESRKRWSDFRAEYESKIADAMEPNTRRATLEAMNHFERICKPQHIRAIRTKVIDGYVAKRQAEPGKKKGDTVSPATVNKELRHLKSVLRIAHDWGYLSDVPRIRMLKEPRKLPRYVTPEHFAAIYKACEHAKKPQTENDPYTPAEWWRALITMCYMTGWRINEVLSLRREDIDFEAQTAITRATDNKGKRDELVPLHPVVIDHLWNLASFSRTIFAWPHHERTLWSEFARIQQAAEIDLPCREGHEHTTACKLYGFHDLRRAFATMNAERLSADALQALMRHQSYLTTQRYINMARQLNRSVEALHVPDMFQCKAESTTA